MPLEPAPFLTEPTDRAIVPKAYWVDTSDGLRIRIAAWTPPDGARGTVVLFPGRTEYVEKYDFTAVSFAERGFATIAVDWRGQGLATRMLANRMIGHVERFSDYQKDVSAMLRAARRLELPRPYHLLGHSMGGAIGLRAATEGLAVQTCAFTGPMFGIRMPTLLRLVAMGLTRLGPAVGLGHWRAPTTPRENYVLANPFEGNQLTTDPEIYALLQAHLRAHPDLQLAGPSLQWLREALDECDHLAGRAAPDMPGLTMVGDGERIVDIEASERRMSAWPRGRFDVIKGAQHEVLMETADVRRHCLDRLVSHFTHGEDLGTAT
jgi:lysophospholipase